MKTLKETIAMINSWDYESWNVVKISSIISIVIIMIGGYWWLELKTLSLAMLMIAIGIFVVATMKLKNLPEPKSDKKKESFVDSMDKQMKEVRDSMNMNHWTDFQNSKSKSFGLGA